MARLARLVAPNHPHHIVQYGHDGVSVFRDDQDYRSFLAWLREAARQFRVAVHAYVLMPDHLQLLATPQDETGLARMMQWVGRQYVPYFNARYGRRGTLWQGRYRAVVLEPGRYLLACSRYLEFDPVRAGLNVVAVDYPWSSCAHHVGMRPDPLITDHADYWSLGNTPFDREAAYRVLMEDGVPASEAQLFSEAARKGWPLGSEQYKATLARQLGRRVAPGARGRPAKQSAANNGM